MEKQINHSSGSIQEAQEIILSLQDLLNFDYGSVYYHLIRIMMADMRIEHLPATCSFDDDSAENWFSDVTSKLDLAKILIMKDC